MLNKVTKFNLLISFVLPFVVCALFGCQNYPVTFNGSPIKAPTLLSGYQLTDKNLAICVGEHIFDQKITRFGQLRQLNCAQRSIKSLHGIEQFHNLLKVDISGNPINSVAPLLAIKTLEEVTLAPLLNSSGCTEVKNLQDRGVAVKGVCTAR
jgi:Leucine-rich repeat (LRR) protein